MKSRLWVNTMRTAGLLTFASLLLGGGCRPDSTMTSSPMAVSILTNRMPTLTSSEVMVKFRERASAATLKDYERLVAENGVDSQTRAMELVLFRLTADELSRIGITQNEGGSGMWCVAESTTFADNGKAFEEALHRVGIRASGVMELGLVGWYVPREHYFTALSALRGAGLRTNEIKIIEPQFHLQ